LWDRRNINDQLSSQEDDKALPDYKALLKVACARLLFHPALVNAKTQEARAADKTCQKDAWSKPEASQFLVNQGRAMARQGNVGEAVDRFKQAQMLNPALKIDPKAEAQQLAALASSENEEQKQNKNSEVIPPKLPNHATYGQVKLSEFTLNNKGNVVRVAPGEKISASANYIYYCRNCQGGPINQIIVGIAGQNQAQACIYNSSIQGSGSSKFTLTAPNEPGIYYIRFRYAQAYGCAQGALGWWRVDGEPTPEANIGTIVVVGQEGQSAR
jgi:hypothetical protein